MTYDMEQLNRIQPGYLAAYGLTDAPFSPKHDDRFLYLSPELTAQLEMLRHYTQYGNLLLIVSGERGIGKTSLKQRFITSAEDEWQICEIPAHTMMDAGLLLRQAAMGFGITDPPLDPRAILEVLTAQLQHLQEQAQIPILIIDDAHELPLDALQALLYLAEHHVNQASLLRIILFCEPQIDTMLEDPSIHALKERVTHKIELAPLTEEQTAEYLRHRLAVAGLDGTSPFTPKLVSKIYKASQGLPAQINEYAHQNLEDDREPLIPDAEEISRHYQEPVVSSFNLRNIVIGGIALVVVVAVLLFQDKINQLFEEPTTSETTVSAPPPETTAQATAESTSESEPETAPQLQAPAEPPVAAPTTPPPESKTIEFALNKSGAPDTTQAVSETAPQAQTVTEPHIEQPPPQTVATEPKVTPELLVLSLKEVIPNPVPAQNKVQSIQIKGEGFNARQQVNVSWGDNQKTLAASQVKFIDAATLELMINVGSKADHWTVTVNDPSNKLSSNTLTFNVVAAAPASPKTTTTTAKVDDASWIKAQPADYYTLQLLVTSQHNSARKFIQQHDLQQTSVIFKSVRNGNDLYTVIHGSYTNKAAASAAISSLPKGIKPWPRSFASIQQLLATQTVSPTVTKQIVNNKPPANPADQLSWLWSQNPSHWTLQLTAGKSEAAIKTFVKHHQLTGKAVYFHRLRDGEDWYILLYGNYTDKNQASQAIQKLPSALRKAKPWVRSFGAIHAELHQSQ